ncbi:DivIVA domain-containing protein [Vallitalea okinawensis]|uniref:DivIVA domain-containing protein n=1 Tax=Vallitalea okinawensis TaxID=2078660 RepID=UPI000CFCACD8|nr:DivIVA domain-containing protein [Vallitalea okinawensis]
MLTPLDIENQKFKKTAIGYDSKEVDKFLGKVLMSYERVYKENIELKDKITVLNDGIQYYKTMEKTLQDTLVSAEKSASDVKSAAYKKADAIEREAEIRAKQQLDDARNSLFEMNQQITALQKQYDAVKIEISRIFKAQLEILDRETDHINKLSSFEEAEVAATKQKPEELPLYSLDDGERL